MAVIMEKPKPTLPPNHRPPGGKPYRVQNGENWVSIANQLGMDPRSLIFFNFGTSEPKHVNYYLKHNVGCTTVSPDGKNYSFWNASPGIIHLPTSASNFHYISAPPSDPVETFTILRMKEFQPEEHPLDPDKIRCQAYFEVNIRFYRSVPDVTRYVYRQFVRGRVRLRSTIGSAWYDEPIMIPGHVPGTDFNVATEVPISPTVWMEDGIMEGGFLNNGVLQGGTAKRYGYREAEPSLLAPHDFYSEPIVQTPPATPGAVRQTGYAYRCTDRPGLGGINKYIEGESINGISIELEFRHEIWDWRDLRKQGQSVRSETRRFDGHFEITSRTPLKFNKIARPA